MPSRPESSSVLIVFLYFLFADHFLPSFPIHRMPLYAFFILSLRLLAAPGFRFIIFKLLK